MSRVVEGVFWREEVGQQCFVDGYRVGGAREVGEAWRLSRSDEFLGPPYILQGGLVWKLVQLADSALLMAMK